MSYDDSENIFQRGWNALTSMFSSDPQPSELTFQDYLLAQEQAQQNAYIGGRRKRAGAKKRKTSKRTSKKRSRRTSKKRSRRTSRK